MGFVEFGAMLPSPLSQRPHRPAFTVSVVGRELSDHSGQDDTIFDGCKTVDWSPVFVKKSSATVNGCGMRT